MQVGIGDAKFNLVLTAEYHGFAVARSPHEVLGKAHPRIGKEPRSGHLQFAGCLPFALVADDTAEVPDEVPKAPYVLNRPGMQMGIARKAFSGTLFGSAQERRVVRRLNSLGGGLPHYCTGFHCMLRVLSEFSTHARMPALLAANGRNSRVLRVFT